MPAAIMTYVAMIEEEMGSSQTIDFQLDTLSTLSAEISAHFTLGRPLTHRFRSRMYTSTELSRSDGPKTAQFGTMSPMLGVLARKFRVAHQFATHSTILDLRLHPCAGCTVIQFM